MSQLCSAKAPQYQLSTKDVHPQPLLKKEREGIPQMGLSLEILGLMTYCQVLRRRLVSYGVLCSFAAYSRADRQTGELCPTPAGLCPSGLKLQLAPVSLPQQQRCSSYSQHAPSTWCCTQRSKHQYFLWVNRANLQHFNKKRWKIEPPIYDSA